MHQQQWLAVIEELGVIDQLPIPNSHPESEEHREFSYVFIDPRVGDATPLEGRFTEGPSIDGKGEFTLRPAEPHGREPSLAPPDPRGGAQTEQLTGVAAGGHARAERKRGARAR